MDRRGAPTVFRDHALNESRAHAVQPISCRSAPNGEGDPRRAHTDRSRSGVFQRCTQPCSSAHDRPYFEWTCSEALSTAATNILSEHHAPAPLPALHHHARPKLGSPWHIHDGRRHAAPRRKWPDRRRRPVGIRTVVRARVHERRRSWIQGALHTPSARHRPRPPSAA